MDVPLAILLCFFTAIIFFNWGHNRKKVGLISLDGGDLPDVLFTVVYHDKFATTLRENTPNRQYWTVSSQVFAGKPIKPKDIVRRTTGVDEMQKLGISIPQPFDIFVRDFGEIN